MKSQIPTSIRAVVRTVTAHQQREGAGFLVRRPFPTTGLDQLDPFLMLDEVGPVDYAPGAALGAPDHPHRGFETVTYVIAGEKLHEDSAGVTQIIRAGDVQWMTAGAGIVHSEMPSPAFHAAGGLAHGFQIWVNLPARDKLARPGYQHLPAAGIPSATTEDGLVRVKVIAGQALGVSAEISTHTPIILQDWTLLPGGAIETAVPAGHNLAAYVFQGAVEFGRERNRLERGQLAIFGPGDGVRFAVSAEAAGAGRLLLLGGTPIAEPVARYGPFVMNSQDELEQAFADFQSGAMGRIERA